ncbi:hypothetical protein F5877DRAFT_83071 [Lentinula edodes]|nr:hypothetical protein F5877DRAFT_83071 [Lentinula edodes]
MPKATGCLSVMPWLQPDPSQYQPPSPIHLYTSPSTTIHLPNPQIPPCTSPIITIPLTYLPNSPTPNALVSQPPQLLHKLWDLDPGNVEATPHIELHAASPLPPPILEDVHLEVPVPGTSPPGHISSQELGPPWTLQEPPQGSHLSIPATTRSFLSSVAVPVAPFELQPAPSMLQHKLVIPKPTLRPILTQVLHYTKLSRHRTDLSRRNVGDSTLSRGNTTQAQKSNQAASSTVIMVAAGQRLMSIPEQSFGDETARNVRTPKGCQPAVQEPPPVEPVMGPPQWRYTSMGYAQPGSSPMGGFAYFPTGGTRGPPPGPVPQLQSFPRPLNSEI